MDAHRYLRSFVALAETLHFGQAAQRLGIAQPPLSNQIKRLEKRVGTPLFARRPAVALTRAGEAFLEHARRAVGAADRGVEEARRVGRGESGRLILGFAASTILSPVPLLTRRFLDERPEVDLVLREIPSARQYEALKQCEIDIAVLREPQADPEIEIAPILSESFVLALPANHRLRSTRSVGLRVVAGEPFVHFPRHVAPGLYDKVTLLCREAGFTPRVRQEALEWLTIVGLVEAGLGVSLVPASFARLRWGGVRYVSLRSAARTVTAVCAHRVRRPVMAQRFFDVAIAAASS